jgi:hypothetical protein
MLNVKFEGGEINPVAVAEILERIDTFDPDSAEIKHCDSYLRKTENFFIAKTRNALVHVLFIEALRAGRQKLYLSGSLAIITSLEISLKYALSHKGYLAEIAVAKRIGRMPNLGGRILRTAKKFNLPIEVLALGHEDFSTNIPEHPILVQIRNDITHGNFAKFEQRTDTGDAFFTRECLRGTYNELLCVLILWVQAVAKSRALA